MWLLVSEWDLEWIRAAIPQYIRSAVWALARQQLHWSHLFLIDGDSKLTRWKYDARLQGTSVHTKAHTSIADRQASGRSAHSLRHR